MSTVTANPSAAPISVPRGRELPPSGYSVSAGGTIFSTTPGGTRIVYNRDSLLFMRNSPLSRTPPAMMVSIPGVTAPSVITQEVVEEDDEVEEPVAAVKSTSHRGEDEGTFHMEL
eukprot:GILJ01002048.1.p1 GENE.GILJ01002048.1~~GILJ01002048.1.p1  ORF type:complete len:115 (-),score=9.73 GILJ01002048.1:289-633(-)